MKLSDRFVQEMAGQGREPAVCILPLQTLVNVIACVQLASKHPQASELAAVQEAARWARYAIKEMPESDLPATRMMLDVGWWATGDDLETIDGE